jgi:hypothetical protein
LVSREENVPEYPVSEDIEVQRLQEAAMEQQKQADALIATEKGFNKKREVSLELDGNRPEKSIPSPGRFDPYPTYGLGGDRRSYAPPVKCYVDPKEKREVPQLLAFNGTTQGLPDPVMGSYDLFGLRKDVCFERHGRLGPYGFGYSRKFGGSGAGIDGDREGSEHVWDGELEIDYRKVNWAQVQKKCEQENAHRFKPMPKQRPNQFFTGSPVNKRELSTSADEELNVQEPGELLNRTVVLIRTWTGFEYDAEDMFYLRALVNELSIQSGTEYVVHFLIHVKDDNAQIWADDDTYERVLNDALPAEFQGMGSLWSERQMGLIYGGVAESFYRDLPVHGAYRSTYMPVQYFAHMHPEFDFIWHWEMDIRYTGHFYHLFQQVSQWAKKQPRKGLWERNGRFYVPAEHGSWEDFRQMVRIQTEHGTASKENMYSKLAADAGTHGRRLSFP